MNYADLFFLEIMILPLTLDHQLIILTAKDWQTKMSFTK